MNLDNALIDELRTKAREGANVSTLADLIPAHLGQAANSRLMAIAYFHEAFRLPISELGVLGAWCRYGDGQLSDEEIEKELGGGIRKSSV